MSATPATTATEYQISSWDISELLPEPTEEVISRELGKLEDAVARFEAQREKLNPDLSPEAFLGILRGLEAIVEQMDTLGGYASLWFSSDTQSSAALSFRTRMQQVLTRLENRVLFFSLWWKELDEAEAERLLPDAETEIDFRHYLLEVRRFKPHTLDERSEQLINVKDASGMAALLTLYSMITNRMEFEVTVEGEKKTLTEGELRSLFYSPDPEVRRASYLESFRVYEGEAKILAQIYANRVRDWHGENVELRGFSSPIAVRNLWNDVPDAAVEALLETVRENAPLFQDYFRLKAGWLGQEKLSRFDIYAPLASSDRQIPYGEGVSRVLGTFHDFDPRFASLAERIFAENHIDSEIRKGKKGGAFCATVLPRFTPWVLVNYTGRARDVATLAHELGHAVHSLMADEHSVLTQHPSLPLAETASVFAELLITDRLLREESDPKTRRELLASAVDDVYATVLRQAYFVRFEIAAHQAILENRSSDELYELYLENLHDQFGESVEIAPEFRYEWVSIPHIFNTPFYCYAYSFGQLLVLALYRRYQQEGDAFKPGYFRLLAFGGAARPEEMLAELGIDITDPAFWRGGFEVVRGMIAELEAMES